MVEMTYMFSGKFGRIREGLCRLSMKGGIAVKTAGGYKIYDVRNGTLTNVTNFCFDIGSDFFFVVPTSKVNVGDIILVDGRPKCVIGTTESKTIKVIEYETSSIMEIVPERHVFMGNIYFYGKIISVLGNTLKKGKGLENIMKLMMMSQMISRNKSSGNENYFMDLLMMNQLMGFKDDSDLLFDGMFDFEMSGSDEENEDADGEEE